MDRPPYQYGYPSVNQPYPPQFPDGNPHPHPAPPLYNQPYTQNHPPANSEGNRHPNPAPAPYNQPYPQHHPPPNSEGNRHPNPAPATYNQTYPQHHPPPNSEGNPHPNPAPAPYSQSYPLHHTHPNSESNPHPNPAPASYNQPYPQHHPPPNFEGNPHPNPHAAFPYQYAAPGPYPYPYPPPANPYPYPYQQPAYPTPHLGPAHPSYAGPPPQSTTPRSPTQQQSSSFHQYGSPRYQQSNSPVHDNFSSSGLPYNGEQGSENRSSNAPLNNPMADMRLSENSQSVPASPPAASAVPHQADRAARGELSHSLRGVHVRNPSWDPSLAERGHKVNLRGNYTVHSRSPTWDCFSAPKTNDPASPVHSPNNLQLVSFQKGSKVLLLHGNLDLWIYEAKNLPNLDMFHKLFCKSEGQSKNTSDPYVTVTVANAVIARTFVIENDENPVWAQHFNVPVAHHAGDVHFLVKDSDIVGSQLIGNVSVPVEAIHSGQRVEGSYAILGSSGKQCKPGAVLRLSIQYTPMKNLSIYHNGVGAGPDYPGVPGTYFPLRKGGTVTLYQDAHVHDGRLPELPLDWGARYVHGKCWQDIFGAIRQATRLIYITGWSVWHKVTLVRDPHSGSSETTLGELLRSKSAEGVRVLLLIWDDPTSRSILGYRTDGLMATHDEETRRFFKHSSVQVVLCPRAAAKKHSWVKQREVSTIYTHHQKTVIVDADAGNYRRKIIAFVGGLDLCDGRYDTPDHCLFRTLNTVHKEDYHMACYQGSTTGCPRQPWHDLHSKIDGPAAYDVLTNFEERWLKASKRHGLKKLKTADDALLKIERLPDILGIHEAPCVAEDNPEAWHVQVFRSIDSSSVKGFPKSPKDATSKNLVCGKNVLIDMSIHTAYIKAIRAAQHFIYIENQYFIGSSFNWSQHRDLGADNLIPMEIALKICGKIRAHERFAAYIVIPMWPEGIPTGGATQRILYWQNKTMQMMYEMIYKALVEVGLEEAYTPEDYLNFFCLGNREAPDGRSPPADDLPHPPNSPQANTIKYRRFMIYVHSKGMIVDDEYLILGSANINQRSMEGTRDTEIAMGAYQPQYTWATKQASPRGQIHGYRMSLWAEHLGFVDECFTQPASLDCVRKVRAWSEMNWRQFADQTPVEMNSHLLKYPVQVDRQGRVRPIKGCEEFPDVGGDICGSFLAIQENLTI